MFNQILGSLTLKTSEYNKQEQRGTSGMEMVGPLIEEATLLYFVGIDCVTGKAEYGRSSLAFWTVEANKALGNEFVYACC